jgi:hypothetical protein
MELLTNVLSETLQVVGLVLVMMTLVDAVNVWTRGKLANLLRGAGRWRQYVVSSFVGAAPGCMGAFTNVSLYMHGMITFGALVGAMAAVSGDEAFVMLAMIPRTAIVLFGMLFVIGVLVGWGTDLLVKRYKIKTCQDCEVPQFHPTQEGLGHYLRDHVWHHIIRRHLWRTALWTFGALLVMQVGLHYGHLEQLTSRYPLLLLFAGALIGLIPESGPHLIFVTMFANGLVPFSVLFTSSFVQDGHGMLPMLSYSLQDSIKIKLFNFCFGLAAGLLLFAVGL